MTALEADQAPRRFLGIEPGERSLVVLLFGQYFFTGTASAFTQTAGFALFLGAFDAGKLPYTFILMGAVISLLTLGYIEVGRRIGFANQLRLSLGGQIVITAAFALGLTLTSSDWIVFCLPVLFQIAVVFGNMAFWSLAGRMFNVQQGKRLFGVVGTGEWLGIVVVGFLAPVFVPLVGLQTLLWLAALAMCVAMLAMNLNMRRHAHLLTESAPPKVTTAEPTASAPRLLGILRSPYVLALFGLSMAWWIGFFFIDNIFYLEAARQMPGSEQLAAFIGIYLGIVGIFSLVSNLFVAGPVVSRFGLRWSLLVLPAGLAIGAVVMTVTGTLGGLAFVLFCVAVATKIWSVGIGFSIDQSARSVLFQPFSATLRTRVQTLVDGVAQPIATAAAGALLLVVSSFLPQDALPLVYGLMAIVAAHLLILVLVNRGYGRALVEALSTRRLTGRELVITGAESRAALLAGLDRSEPGAVIYAMRLLATAEPSALATQLPKLLARPEPQIRRYALTQVAELGLHEAIGSVRAAVAVEAAPDVLATGIRTLARLGDRSEALARHGSGDPQLRAGAIVALLESGDAAEIAIAERTVQDLAASSVTADRIEAANILAEAGAGPAVALLDTLLADGEPAVRRAALRAVGHRRPAELWPAVIDALRHRKTRSAALLALCAGGSSALPAIGAALRPGTLPAAETARLALALWRVRLPEAMPILLPLLEHQNARVRGAALRALQQCGYRPAPAEMPRLGEWLRNEVSFAAWLSAVTADLEDCAPAVLTRSALAEEFLQCRDRLLALLALGGDSRAIARAAENLDSLDARRRSYALEVIDVSIPLALKPMVLPVLEDLPVAQRLQRLGHYYPQERTGHRTRLLELAHSAARQLDAWTQASALHALNQLDPDAVAGLGRRTSVGNPLIEETLAALRRNTDTTNGGRRLFSIIEKTIMLRSASIFAETSDEVLADVAAIATVVEAVPGTPILMKGEVGESMYVIATGRVSVHDADHELARLGPGDVFGEMALIDPETRSASVTAIEETCLLQLDQQGFFELVDDRPEVARGLLRVLSRRLREAI